MGGWLRGGVDIRQQRGSQQVGVSRTVTVNLKDALMFHPFFFFLIMPCTDAGMLSHPAAGGCFHGVPSVFPAAGYNGTLRWWQAQG